MVYVHNPAFHQAPLRDMGLEKPGCVLWAKNIIQFLEPNIPRLSAFERQLLENCPKLGKSNSMLSTVYISNSASCFLLWRQNVKLFVTAVILNLD